MIQRIQTAYLLLFVIFCATLYVLPICTVAEGSVMHIFSIREYRIFDASVLKEISPVYSFSIYNAVLMALGLTIIFMFKNRKLQIRMCSFLILAVVVFILLVFQKADHLVESNAKPIYNLGMYLLVVSVLWIYLAMRAISKDEKLVRSADRLR
ncbi:MAG: DUF4293 domain-containing protein [Bacteroidetes bacterium]|jgi:hypothetical protein|nr:DUF4293 domain-containing protein [Bacteroidota bacterium]